MNNRRPWETAEFIGWLSELAGQTQVELAGQRGFLQITALDQAQLFSGHAAQQAASGTPLAYKLATYDPINQVIILFVAGGKGFEYTLTLQSENEKWMM